MRILDTLEPKDWVTLVGISVTLLIGIINLINGIRINKRTVFVNAITSERVKWMSELKELISEYLSLTQYYSTKQMPTGDAQDKYLERLVYLENRIKLHLNYIDEEDEEINILISKINYQIFGLHQYATLKTETEIQEFKKTPDGKLNKEELIESTERLVYLSRVYLKTEWEKVKREAQKGKL